jgi:hypothetical protein
MGGSGLISGTEASINGTAAIGRIPVVSASGEQLMPCKPKKAVSLLSSGKAIGRWTDDGRFYIQLKFDPRSPIKKPQAKQRPAKEDAKLKLILDSSYLAKIRKEAWRAKVWFKALTQIERGLFNLSLKCVKRPRSPRLIDALAKIIVKIRRALMSPIYRLMEYVGRPLAKRLSLIAQGWGRKTAKAWAEDKSFIRYLAIVEMNNIPGFRLSSAIHSSAPVIAA